MRENESGHRVQHPFVSKIPVGREKAPFLLTLPVDRKPVTTLVFFKPFHHHIKGKLYVPDLAAVTGLFCEDTGGHRPCIAGRQPPSAPVIMPSECFLSRIPGHLGK